MTRTEFNARVAAAAKKLRATTPELRRAHWQMASRLVADAKMFADRNQFVAVARLTAAEAHVAYL